MTREELRERGRALREGLGLAGHLHADVAPGYADLFDELVFGEIWSRDGLSREDRLIVTIAALAALERNAVLVPYARAALSAGVGAGAIREVVLQAGLYIGFPAAEVALRALADTLGDAGGAGSATGPADTDGLDAAGGEMMRALHGARSTAGYASPDHPTTGDLYTLAIRYGYGVLWNRPGLARRERFLVSVTVFAVLEQTTQLEKFARSAVAVDLTFDEVREVLIHTAPYGGFPRALNALAAVAGIE